MDLSGAMLIGTIGFGLLIYGEKELRIPQLVAGILLIVYPYFVEGTGALIAVGTAAIGGRWLALRAGV